MGIVHTFVRATSEELTRAIADPTSFEGTSGRPPEEVVELDKALPDIQELLVAADVKVDLELGGKMIFPYGNDTDFVMVWSVDDVADTAEQLRDVPFDRLATFIDDPDLVDDRTSSTTCRNTSRTWSASSLRRRRLAQALS
jgi:hypothetical protein